MIYNFTGETKGKTSSALGTAFRALGYNKKVRAVFFMKHWNTSETEFIKKLGDEKLKGLFDIECYKAGDKDFIYIDKEFNNATLKEVKDTLKFGNVERKDEADVEKANRGLKKALSYLEEEPFLLILDELNCAIDFKLLDPGEVCVLLDKAREQGTHVIITGRGLHKEIQARSDLVTEMVKVKHPFDEGIYSVKGLDY